MPTMKPQKCYTLKLILLSNLTQLYFKKTGNPFMLVTHQTEPKICVHAK